MKKYLYLFLLFIGLINAQNKEYVLDPAGKKSNFQYLFNKYPDNSMEYRITKDSGKVFQITAPTYEIINSNYDTVRKILPEYPSKIKNDSLIYIIQYFYKKDHTFLDENNTHLLSFYFKLGSIFQKLVCKNSSRITKCLA